MTVRDELHTLMLDAMAFMCIKYEEDAEREAWKKLVLQRDKIIKMWNDKDNNDRPDL